MSSDLTTHSPQNFCSALDKDKPIFSYFENVKATKKLKDISISEYLSLVSNQTKKAEYNRLRALSVDEYKKAKLLLSCITGSCLVDSKGRTLKNILFLNGLAVVDFDILPAGYNWEDFKSDLKNDPFTFIVHYSLSGRGLCVFVKVPTGNNFKEVYLSFADYYGLMFGAKIDFLADETRLRFISNDEDIFINWNAEMYTDTLQEAGATQTPGLTDNSDFLANGPAIIFNNSGLAGLEVVNELLTALGYTITNGKKSTIFEYQRANGALKSIVAFYNKDVVLFQVFSPNTGLTKEHYNLFDLYKELKGFTDFEAQKELGKLNFGVFNEAKPMQSNGKESYSLMLDYLDKKEISLNQLTGVIEIQGIPLNDYHISKMLTELSLLSGKNQSKEILISCMDVIATGNQKHPFLQFVKMLEQLPKTDFSKPNELDRLIGCFTSSTPKELIKVYFIRWMLGLFDLHLLQRMTKNVLVVSGAQNSCKTSLGKNILPEPLKQYGKVVEFNQNKMTDAKIALCSILVSCFDEFEDILTKSKTLSEFKNLTSSYDIFERRPYRRNHEQMFRSSLIMATTNEQNILNDSTGNTRFLTLDIQAFDLVRYFTIDLNKVWREIYDLHLKGETSLLNEAERALQAMENKNFESEDFCEGLIENSFHTDPKGFLTSTEILIEMEKNTKQTLSIKRIGQALRKMGIERKSKRVAGVPKYGYALKFNFEA